MRSFTVFIFCVFGLFQCERSVAPANNRSTLPPQTSESSISPTKPEPTPKREKMDKQILAKRVESIDPAVSAIISDKVSQVQQIKTPFLKNGVIHKVSKFAPTRPIVIYVGTIEPDFTSIISAEPEKYFEFIRRSGLVDTSNELRISYLLNFLDVTNSGKRLQVLNSVDDIKERPNLSDVQKTQFNEFREKFRPVIAAPKQSADGSYIVYAVKGQDLVQLNLTIKEDKSIERKETVLEKNLLIPYSL